MIASIRSEWRKNLRRPAFIVAAAAVVGVGLVYSIDYYQAWHPTAAQAAEAHLMRLELYPRELVNNLVGGAFPLGAALALVLGALSAGSDYAWGTLKTALVQRRGRLSIVVGRVVAFEVAMAVLSLLLFAAGAVSSALAAGADHQALVWPAALDLLRGIGAVWLVFACYGSLGILLGTLFRQGAAAVGLGLVYVVILQGILVRFLGAAGGGSYRWLSDLFDGQNAAALLSSFTSPAFGPPRLLPISGTHAVTVLTVYLAVFLAGSAVLVARRDVS